MNQPTSYLSNGKLISFLGVGSQKSGTTALFHYLRQHSDLKILDNEGHFFDGYTNFHGDKSGYDLYHQSFGNVGPKQLAGEMTPGYMFFPYCADRIWKYNPDMRLIFIVRDPAERAYSQWKMSQRNGSKLTFSDMIASQKELLTIPRNELIKEDQKRWFLRRCLYSEQILGMLDYFSLEQMLFIKTEEMRKDLGGTLAKVCSFLEIAAFNKVPLNEMIFSFSHQYIAMTEWERSQLVTLFKPSIFELEKILNWDCSDWLQ